MCRSLVTLAVFLATLAPVHAQQGGVELGLIDCVIEGGTGSTSAPPRTCAARRAGRQAMGAGSLFQRDQQVRAGCRLHRSDDHALGGPGLKQQHLRAGRALAGDYVGASAEVTAAVGAGANFLVGGSARHLPCSSLSVQTQTGLNFAVGVSQFQLRSAGN